MRAIKYLFAMAVCLCMLSGAGNVLADTYYARQIDECQEYVNLREKPDTDSRSLDRVYIGEVVMASRYDDRFSRCCYNGQTGYILSDFLSSDIQPYSEGTFYVTNCNEYISMFRMPTRDSEAVERIPLNAKLDAVYYNDGGDTSGKYVYVKYNGTYGFVLWDYLTANRKEGGSGSMKARQIDGCEYVNLRESPDSSSQSLVKVYEGEVVMAAPYDDSFSYCCYNEQFGYIRSEYLSSNIQRWSDGTFYVTNCSEYISLRRMPLGDSDVVDTIPLGATLDAVYYHDGNYTSDKFVYAKYNGQYGFVIWDYLAPEWHEGGQ
jgi:uncharacterized protein YgiM (DUF1202 family)